jgi:hypothetical protein
MARPLRLELPGSWYHLTARVNEQKAIFRQDRDRLHLLELLEEARGRELSRYVHLNAVRLKGLGLDKAAQRAEGMGAGARPDAGQIKERLERLRQYRWSSYRAYVGKDRCPAWLRTGVVLAMGAPGRDWAQRQAYRRYVEEPVRAGWMESPWERVEVQVGAGWR